VLLAGLCVGKTVSVRIAALKVAVRRVAEAARLRAVCP
jgi:hypothetical protein